ncbi:uncharacterized protein PG986_004390 [Apiospora aurea]|uniref:Uncharacterized protein n=1 Tax=Apiospora aurea TaxID=335848 RepID=A0ABR1QMG1_9PEZI
MAGHEKLFFVFFACCRWWVLVLVLVLAWPMGVGAQGWAARAAGAAARRRHPVRSHQGPVVLGFSLRVAEIDMCTR